MTTSTYDVNGNLVELQSPQGTIYYAYDPATGEEIGVSSPDPSAAPIPTRIIATIRRAS